jgi:5-methylcytosine-specific restriction endonuclease McrA
MDDRLRELVRNRAQGRCEYCRLLQAGHEERFSVDHVVARKHRGSDDPDNLAFSCLRCNTYKGTDLSAIDPETEAVVPIFNPRRDSWNEHFLMKDDRVVGITAIGRATAALLQMNAAQRVRLREALRLEGLS